MHSFDCIILFDRTYYFNFECLLAKRASNIRARRLSHSTILRIPTWLESEVVDSLKTVFSTIEKDQKETVYLFIRVLIIVDLTKYKPIFKYDVRHNYFVERINP